MGEVAILMSAINAGEVFYVLSKEQSDSLAWLFRTLLPTMPITVAVPDLNDVWRAAELKAKHNIAYADAFAAGLAIAHDCQLYTGDPELRTLPSLRVHWLVRERKR